MLVFGIIGAIYFAIFVITPCVCRSDTVQSVQDITHVFLISALVTTEWVTMIPCCCIIYFLLDLIFFWSNFLTDIPYLIHHLCGIVLLSIIQRIDALIPLTVSSQLILIQESALIPICTIYIMKKMKIQIHSFLYAIRLLWYLLSRIYTYQKLTEYLDLKYLLFTTPLIAHNCHVFRIQLEILTKQIRRKADL